MIVTRIIALLFILPLVLGPAIAQHKQNGTGRTMAGNLAAALHEPAALKQLMEDANIALRLDPISVTDNSPVPPSKRKNDFYSWAPYLWPNPATKNGYPYINKDGQTNPETETRSDKPLLRKMAAAVHTLAMAYYYSDSINYAQKSVQLIRTWFLDPKTRMNPNMNYSQCTPGIEKGTSTGIIDSRWFVLVIDAVGILKLSSALPQKDEIKLKQWFRDFEHWLLTSEIGREEAQKKNNHGSWYAAQTACYALFSGNRTLARNIVTSSKSFFDTQIDSAGRQTFELTRTKSFDYSLYNLHALITLAMVGEQVQVDLWHYNMENGGGRNIRKSIEYLASYAGTGKQWPYPQIADKAIALGYEDGDHFSVYYPNDLYSALRIGYKVYKEPLFMEQLKNLPGNEVKKHRSNLLVALE